MTPALLSPRLWLALAVAAALAFSHFAAYRAGRAAVRADWEAERTQIAQQIAQAEAAARAKEQHLAAQNRRIAHAYEAEKQRRAADARAADDALGVLQRALDAAGQAPADATAGTGAAGARDPRDELLGSCAASLAHLGREADRLAGKVGALQEYAREVCVR